jgi:hypothetical protein
MHIQKCSRHSSTSNGKKKVMDNDSRTPTYLELADTLSRMPHYFEFPPEDRHLEKEVSQVLSTVQTVLFRESCHSKKHVRRERLCWCLSPGVFNMVAKRLRGTVRHQLSSRFYQGKKQHCQTTLVSIYNNQCHNENLSLSLDYCCNDRNYHVDIQYVTLAYNHQFTEMNLSWKYQIKKQIYNPVRKEWAWTLVD